MKFTIIIPAYNSAKFINIPLDSLESQTYQEDFEVLIVNDGSTDNIKEVLEPYLLRNKSWKLIDKTNGNWGSVINFVKNEIKINGKYVTILDSDDYFESKMLDCVSHEDSDVVVTGISKKEGNKMTKMPIYLFKKTGLIKKARVFTPVSTPHGKFYKKELFIKMIDLVEGASYQDTVLFNDLISKSNSIKYINEALAVWWRDREGNSTTQEWDYKRAQNWLETCRRIVELKNGHDESVSWALMYLWELKRNYHGEIPFKINLPIYKSKFKWLPFGFRNISKMYFLISTRKYWKRVKKQFF